MEANVRVVMPLAEGFEETEAVAVCDVLRRAGVEVVLAGLADGPVRGSHGIVLGTDATIDRVEAAALEGIVLPGGMPGTRHLAADERVLRLVRDLDGAGKLVAAICAAPLVLAAAGVLEGRRATSHPSVRSELEGVRYVDGPRVVEDGNVVTSRGPGTALEFGLALVERLAGPESAERLAEAMLVLRPAGAR